jgi:hypothetical protein
MSQRNKLMLLTVAGVVASSAYAFADPFYIIREGNGPCQVMDGHPPATVTIIGGDKTYTTREAAEKDMALACKTG